MPHHQHDCECCVYLGSKDGKTAKYDLYFCGNEPTVIARHGDYGNYYSGLMFVENYLKQEVAKGKDRVQALQALTTAAYSEHINMLAQATELSIARNLLDLQLQRVNDQPVHQPSGAPRYKHDCECCVSLGGIKKDRDYDLYFCQQGGNPTVIARFGEHTDYYSSLLMVKTLVRAELDKGASLSQALQALQQEPYTADINTLAKATELSMEKNLIEADYFLGAPGKKLRF